MFGRGRKFSSRELYAVDPDSTRGSGKQCGGPASKNLMPVIATCGSFSDRSPVVHRVLSEFLLSAAPYSSLTAALRILQAVDVCIPVKSFKK